MSTPRVEVRYQFFPTAWDTGVSRRVFELLIGPNKLYPATRWSNEGKKKLPEDDVIEWLTEWYEASFKGNRIPLFTDHGSDQYHFDLLRSEWGDHSLLGQLLHWPKHLDLIVPAEQATKAKSIQAITEVAVITDAPLVPIDFRPSRKVETITLESRREMSRVVKGTIHAHAAAGPWRGLHRIPWRLILGRHIVSTIGEGRLRNLPAEQAIDHGNGFWTLQTTTEPAESISQRGREAERDIIATLGEEFFAATDRNELAKVKPAFPPDLVPDDGRLFEKYGERLKPL
ncbi:MAG: hypothetical protein WBD31_12935 [Rubripirellula sp.]